MHQESIFNTYSAHEKNCAVWNTRATIRVPSRRANHCVLLLSGDERELRLNEANYERAAALLRRVPEFTIVAALRQDEANSGTIVAFSHGNNRYEILKSFFSSSPHYFSKLLGNFGLGGRNKHRAVTYFECDTEWYRCKSRKRRKYTLNIFYFIFKL